jgi:Domain of unknown function (DUF1707)
VSTLPNQAGIAGPASGAGIARPASGAGIAGPASGAPPTRASDTDRDHTVALLSEAFAEGRLTAAEHDQRLAGAYAARTQPQLRRLIADLPVPAPKPAPAPAMPAGADRCLLCVLCIVCPPAAIAWWLLARRRPVGYPDGPLSLPAGPDGGLIGAQDAQDGQDAQGR